MGNDLISVIVPVYNTGIYLEKCLNSILSQDFLNIEVVIVDDGSTDNSKFIIEKFKKLDNRIVAIYEEHKGAANARNIGLKNVKGNYVGFVDSDDYINSDMYSTLYNIITDTNSDISMISFNRVNNGKSLNANYSNELYVYNTEEALCQLLSLKKIKAHLCNKLFKKELFSDIYFPLGKSYEDDAVMVKILENISKFAFLDTPKYNYIAREGSQVNTNTVESKTDFYEVTMANYYYLKGKHKKIEPYLAFYIIDSLVVNYAFCVKYNISAVYKRIEADIDFMKNLFREYEDVILNKLLEFKKDIMFLMFEDLDNSHEEIISILDNYLANR